MTQQRVFDTIVIYSVAPLFPLFVYISGHLIYYLHLHKKK